MKVSETAPAPTVWSPTKTKLHSCNVCTEDVGQTQAGYLVVSSASLSHYGPRLVSYVGFLVVSSISLTHRIRIFLSARFPELCLMFGCESLNLFPSVTG